MAWLTASTGRWITGICFFGSFFSDLKWELYGIILMTSWSSARLYKCTNFNHPFQFSSQNDQIIIFLSSQTASSSSQMTIPKIALQMLSLVIGLVFVPNNTIHHSKKSISRKESPKNQLRNKRIMILHYLQKYSLNIWSLPKNPQNFRWNIFQNIPSMCLSMQRH